MSYWLVKSEPSAWSWDDQVKAGATGEPWTGVRNHTAKQNLTKMNKGDRSFFYHSVDAKSIVGIGSKWCARPIPTRPQSRANLGLSSI